MIGWVKPVAEEITIDDDDDDNEVMVVEGTEKVNWSINQSNINWREFDFNDWILSKFRLENILNFFIFDYTNICSMFI